MRVTDQRGWRRVSWLADALAADGVDLVHAWLYIANALTWAARPYRRRWPLITSARNCKVQGRLSRFTNALAFRASRAIVANSNDVAAYIARQYRAPRQRIRVIYNGIDTERFHPVVQNGGRDPGPIVAIGRLVPQKNHALFLEAAARLSRQMAAVRFMIVGDGPLRPALETRADNLGLAESVSFVGERQDVDVILRSASLLWLPSRWEGMPNVVLEAMASGVPAIATDVGGTRELIRTGVDGFVVPPEDADAFVALSRDLLQDEQRRRQFAAAARSRAEDFSSPRMVQAVTELYAEVLG